MSVSSSRASAVVIDRVPLQVGNLEQLQNGPCLPLLDFILTSHRGHLGVSRSSFVRSSAATDSAILRLSWEGADARAATIEDFGDDDDDEDRVVEISVAIPAALAVMSVCFGLCVLLIAGLPPLSGFVAKFALLSAMVYSTDAVAGSTWWLVGLVIFSGFASLIALTRTGINTFWMPMAGEPAPVRILEIAPVAILLALTVAMTALAGPVMDYMTAAAAELHSPARYVSEVLQAAHDRGGGR